MCKFLFPVMDVKKKLFFLLIFPFFFASCRDNSLNTDAVVPLVVFDYAKEEEKPACFLVVSVKLFSDAKRIVSVKILNVESGYCWLAEYPQVSAEKSGGSVNFCCAASAFDDFFPDGKYIAFITDSAGEEQQIPFSVNYDRAFVSASAEKAMKLLGTKCRKYAALYTKNGDLLYYLLENKLKRMNFWLDFKNAVYMRMCFVASDKSVCCIMPAVYKD